MRLKYLELVIAKKIEMHYRIFSKPLTGKQTGKF